MVAACQFVFRRVAEGKNVHVHCIAGKHRTGSFACAAVALLSGCSFETATEQFREQRGLDWGDMQIIERIATRLGLPRWIEDHRIRDRYLHIPMFPCPDGGPGHIV